MTPLVNHVFADDMNKVRSFVGEAMNTYSRVEMTAAVLCGTFQTHQMVEKYMRYGIEKYPSISSEYVKFLVTDSPSRGHENEIREKVDVMVDMIGEVEKVTKGEKTAIGSASNVIDHLKRRMEKVEKK